MKQKFFFVVFSCFLFVLTSCSNHNNIESYVHKQSYIDEIAKMSNAKRKKQLERDADFIQQTLDSISDLTIYYGFSFSMSSGSSTDRDIDTAHVFTLAPREDYLKDFSILDDTIISANQSFTQGDVDFDFYTVGSDLKAIKSSDLKYTIKKVYEKGKPVIRKSNFLLPIDSLEVEVNYKYPLSFDTITINTGVDSVVYKNQTITIESDDETTLEIELPIDINILGYKAISQDGVLMDQTSYSSFPVLGFSKLVINEMLETIALLRDAAQAQNKAKSLSYLTKISEDVFSKMSLMSDLYKEYKSMRDKRNNKNKDFDEVSASIKAMIEQYVPLFTYTKTNLNLTFPIPYRQVYLYASSETETLSKELTLIPVKKTMLAYNVFTDSTKTKHGIMDIKGEIIIPAVYYSILQYDTLYYSVKENIKDKEHDAFLDYKTRKFESLPAGIKYRKQLTSDLAVFSDKEDFYGVLRNNKSEVVPFKYDEITLIGKTIIARASKRGRPYYLFYTLDGKQMDIPSVKDMDMNKKTGDLIIIGSDKKYGYIDSGAIMTINPNYYNLDRIGNNLLSFIVHKDDLVGIINDKGNVIQQPQFNSVGYFDDDLAPISITSENYNRKFLYGYINLQGQVVIDPQYTHAETFYKGYALVVKDDIYYLIDKNGNIVKKFDADYVSSYLDEDSEWDDPQYYYETNDGISYNYKGEPLK